MDIKDINTSSAYHVSTVEPPLSGGHPWGPGTWDLCTKGCPLTNCATLVPPKLSELKKLLALPEK